jgi:hypothetical protein
MYYAYLLMKKDGYIVPTNTLNVKLTQSDFKGFSGNNNMVISPGTVFYYYDHGTDTDNDYATVTPPVYEEGLDEDLYPNPMTTNADGELVRVFEYISPFLISVDDDLITSYLMTLMDENKTFQFASINTDSDLQFIATNMNWKRQFISEYGSLYDNKYIMTMDIAQNNTGDYNLVISHKDANGDVVFDDVRIKVIMVMYADDTSTNPYRYIEGELTEFSGGVYTFRFVMGTDDVMDLNNRINITGIYNAKPEALQPKTTIESSHGYMNSNTYAKVFIMADFGTKEGDVINGTTVTAETEEIVLYGEDGIGNRTEIESLIPNRDDVVDAFLNNEIYLTKDGSQVSIVSIIRSNSAYLDEVKKYNNNDQETNVAILRYLRNNKNSEFVQNIILKDEDVIAAIDSYSFVDLSRYSVCNVMAVDGGLDFYQDYSPMMRSTVSVVMVQKTDENGNPVYTETKRTDSLGNEYTEYKPVYLTNENNTYYYDYKMYRVPMVMNGYFSTEDAMQDYIFYLDERRKYITECLYVLEDTFDIDLKFFNTFGPSRTFYYDIPSSTNYKATVAVKELKVLSSTVDEDDKDALVATIPYSTQIKITKIKGQWGYITSPYEGWVKIADTAKCINYIDNVALNFKFALEAESSADKYITDNIINDVKEYIEDINEVNELHIPNVITLITNNYREQLVYFEFMDVNGYGSSCQHLYLDSTVDADICPEFLNVETLRDGTNVPNIGITVY